MLQTIIIVIGVVGSLSSLGQFIYTALSYHGGGNMRPQDSSMPKFPYGRVIFFVILTLGAAAFNYYDRHYSNRDAMSALFSLPGYDRFILARSSREGAEEGYKRASHVWAASIAGVYFTHLPPESRAKIDRVIFVDPSSASMKILASIQEPRGKDFSTNVERAVDLCTSPETKELRKDKETQEIQVRLSSHPVLNVVLFDPGTPHAWARIQEFIPYHLGEESAVYAIRKEEWKDLYNTIEDSFKQTWENGRDPNKIY
jgi:hypothetical protein